MTKFEKVITVNLGNFQSVKVGVSDCPSFVVCDEFIVGELKRLGVPVDKRVRQSLSWLEK